MRFLILMNRISTVSDLFYSNFQIKDLSITKKVQMSKVKKLTSHRERIQNKFSKSKIMKSCFIYFILGVFGLTSCITDRRKQAMLDCF